MRLSFVNEATRLSDYSGANLTDVLKGVGLDNRIGSHYFRPSPSWGGSCFPKDLVEVNNFYKKDELNLPLISNIIDSNNEHLNWTVNQLLSLKNNNNLEKIVLVGAAFKENTDDLRNSPTLDIYKILDNMGVQVSILDIEIEVPNHNYFSSVEDINLKSLIAIMYPLNDDLDKELLDYSSQNDCIIFYPWR
jgi:UDPglucose 6-dehydrogenase